jgi:hypothetical protein
MATGEARNFLGNQAPAVAFPNKNIFVGNVCPFDWQVSLLI